MDTAIKKNWTRDEIDNQLRQSDAWVEHAILTLFKLQTSDEQHTAHTAHDNKVGFNHGNAKAGTRFARFLSGMNDKNEVKFPKKSLNHPIAAKIFARYCDGQRPIDRARKIALTHSMQLVKVANGELEVPK